MLWQRSVAWGVWIAFVMLGVLATKEARGVDQLDGASGHFLIVLNCPDRSLDD